MSYLLPIHVLAACLWVGGMFFAYMVLAPNAGLLPPEQKLTLWKGVLKRFFTWVWLAIIMLLLSGYIMMLEYFGGFRGVAHYIQAMQGLFWLMTFIFLYVYVVLFSAFCRKVNNKDWPAAATVLARIRRIVALNLVLGVITILIASSGRYL